MATLVTGSTGAVGAQVGALADVRTLFLPNAVTPDEVTQALIALNRAREAGVERIVYFSVIHSERFTNVPHFTGKYTVERMIAQFDLPATTLRPAYFMQNDAALKDAVAGHGVYPMPVGDIGASMVDTRDIAEVAALHLLRRDRAAGPLPGETLNLVGPDVLTGAAIANIWTGALGRPIQYAGGDVERLTALLGRPLRSYRDFAVEAAKRWTA